MKQTYLYVDETGQDTKGAFFLVAVVIVERDFRQRAEGFCQEVEYRTGKRSKWTKTRKPIRWAYMERILQTSIPGLVMMVIEFRTGNTDYWGMTFQALYTVLTPMVHGEEGRRIKIFVDALSKTQAKEMGVQLRQRLQRAARGRGVYRLSVRGLRTERSTSLLRLADALCGFARAVIQKEPQALRLWERYGQRIQWLVMEK